MLFLSYFLFNYSEISGEEVKQEDEGRNHCRYKADMMSSDFLTNPRNDTVHNELDSPTSAINSNNPVHIWLQVNLIWHFLSWESFVPNGTTFCQIDIKQASELDPLENFIKRWCYCSKIGHSHNIIVLGNCLKEENRMLTVYLFSLQIMNWENSHQPPLPHIMHKCDQLIIDWN